MAGSLSRRQLAGLGALALLPRLANLGSFSLWLDEVIETEQASGSLGHLVSELREDAVHPPLQGLLSWTLLHLGFGETGRRLVAVTLGVATVLLLAHWTARRFGERAGLAVGAVAALSPVGVHYAQELRPYALALFLMAAALCLLDRLLDPPAADPDAGRAGQEPGTWLGRREAVWGGLLLAAVAGCFYTLYLSALVLVPLGWMVLEAAFGPPFGPLADPVAAARRRRGRRLLALSPLFLLALGLAYLPWVPTVLALRGQRIQRAPGPWSLGSAFDRFEDLTVGGGGPVPAWAGLLALALAAVGLAAALRRAPGRVAVAGFLAGTVGVEILLAAGRHWSSLRYDLVGWPFLMIVLGLGVAALAAWPGGRWPGRWMMAGGLAILAVAQLAGIVQYYLGREDWQTVAAAVAAARRPEEPAFALNQSTRIGLVYYLDELAGRPPDSEDPPWLASVDGSAERLAELWPADRCALLVTQSWGRQGKVVRLAREFPELAAYPATFARLFLLTAEGRGELFRSGRQILGPAAPGTPPCDRTLPPALALPRTERRFGRLEPALAALGYETGLRPGTLPH